MTWEIWAVLLVMYFLATYDPLDVEWPPDNDENSS